MDSGIAPGITSAESSSTSPIFSTPTTKRHKSPGLAFVMSLFVPGSGQLYCGKTLRGLMTLVFFVIGVGVAAAIGWPKDRSTELLWGMCARVAVALYGFGFLDAYFTAHEVNRDIDLQVDGSNPRVAAILNLLTKGFGYFYLGQKKLGIGVFIVLTVLTSSVRQAPADVGNFIGIILEVVLAMLAIHAWILARRELATTMPPEEQVTAITEEPKGLRPALPMALGGLMALNYALLVSIGLMVPDYTKIDQAPASLKTDGGVITYSNAKYGLRVDFPEGWKVEQGKEGGTFVEASKYEGLCSVQMMASAELFPGTSDEQVILAELRKKFPKTYLVGVQPAKLGGVAGNEIAVTIPLNDEAELHQRYIMARRRWKFDAFSMIATYAGDNECNSEAEQIRKSVVLPK